MLHVTMIDADGNQLGTTSVSVCPPVGAKFPAGGKDYVISEQEFPEPCNGYVRDRAIFTLVEIVM